MTREEAFRRVRGYLNDCLPIDCGEEIEEIMKALEQEPILDKIRDEIDAESARSFKYPNWERAKALEWALEIIDKYRGE